MMEARTAIPTAKVLFQNKKWSIEKISEKEVAITDSWSVCYAYLSADKGSLVYDRIICPKYIQEKALKVAQRNIVSIYK